jgi:hypothetical protein
MIIHNATLTGSISMQAPPVISGSLTLTGSINATGDITASSARFSNIITAQTLVVQVVSSSTEYASGSNIFGNNSSNTHQFTGSVLVSGSFGLNKAVPQRQYTQVANANGIVFAIQNAAASNEGYIVGFDATGSTYLQLSDSANASKVYLNSSGSSYFMGGNVGMGTTNPSAKLHLYDGTNPLSFKIQRTSVPVYFSDVQTGGTIAGAAWSHNVENTSNGSLSWGSFNNAGYAGAAILLNSANSTSWITLHTAASVNTNPSERVRIDGSGNVGIGTTSPTSPLTVKAASRTDTLRLSISGSSAVSDAVGITFGSATYDKAQIIAYNENTGNAAGYLTFWTGGSPATTDVTERMRINSLGYVGIGTTNPVQKFHVEGSSAIGTTGTEDILILGRALSGGVSFQQAASLKLGRYQNAGGAYESYTRLDFALRDNSAASNYNTNTTVMTLTNQGYVGIGISSPSKLFVVRSLDNNTTTFAGFYALNETQGPEIWYGGIQMGGSNTNVDLNLASKAAANIIFTTNSTTRMTIASNGSIGAPSGTNIYNASDVRLKRNVTTITNGLSKINALNPVKFNWIEGFEPTENEKDLLGFIAQEVQSVIPEAIESFGNSVTAGTTVIENPLRVNEKFIIPVLVKAIQELKAQIDELKNK